MGPNRIRAAVFIDFDNIFGGLLDLDPKAAIAFAQEPQDWLPRLAAVGAGDADRSYLVRRCYMNPAGWRQHAALGPDRVFFSRYRPFFTKAGFEVIDCPSLTYRHKNAADIRICLDMVDTLSRTTRYDEYVIASGDSDFTPLLQRLRAADRRITVVASSQTAVAYESVADLFLDEQEVIELMTGVTAEESRDVVETTEISVEARQRPALTRRATPFPTLARLTAARYSGPSSRRPWPDRRRYTSQRSARTCV